MTRTELENEIADTMSREIQKEVDESILLEMLVEGGWTKVPFYFTSNKHAIDVKNWCGENLTENQWKHLAGCFVVRKKKEAEWFILRWL